MKSRPVDRSRLYGPRSIQSRKLNAIAPCSLHPAITDAVRPCVLSMHEDSIDLIFIFVYQTCAVWQLQYNCNKFIEKRQKLNYENVTKYCNLLQGFESLGAIYLPPMQNLTSYSCSPTQISHSGDEISRVSCVVSEI